MNRVHLVSILLPSTLMLLGVRACLPSEECDGGIEEMICSDGSCSAAGFLQCQGHNDLEFQLVTDGGQLSGDTRFGVEYGNFANLWVDPRTGELLLSADPPSDWVDYSYIEVSNREAAACAACANPSLWYSPNPADCTCSLYAEDEAGNPMVVYVSLFVSVDDDGGGEAPSDPTSPVGETSPTGR